jgi:hypothetical protein
MSARSQYIKHFQGYLEQSCQRPINLLRDEEWRAHGIEPFKIKLTDLPNLLDTAAVIAPVATMPLPIPTPTPAPIPEVTPTPTMVSEVTEELVGEPGLIGMPYHPEEQEENEEMSATFSTGSYVKVIAGDLIGNKGIIQTHDEVRAKVNLDTGVTVSVELANLARSKKTPEVAKPTGAAPAATQQGVTAPATTAGTATAATTATTAAPAAKKKKPAPAQDGGSAVAYRFKIKLYGKVTSDSEEHPTEQAAVDAGNKKLAALKAVLPEAAPTIEIEKIVKAVYSLTIIGEEPIEGDYDTLLNKAVHVIKTFSLPMFNGGVELEVKNKYKFIADLAERTGVDVKVLRPLLIQTATPE